MEIRIPVVAGQFYNSDKQSLSNTIEELLDNKAYKYNNTFAVISPHAGYIYSGKTAAKIFSSIKIPKTVIILSPNHTGMGYPISLHPAKQWSTPLGLINTDQDFLKKLKSKINLANFDTSSQAREHALEVQLPFIQMINKDTNIVPITLANLPIDVINKFSKALAELIIEYENTYAERPMIVASSDMTHFESEKKAYEKDMQAIDKIKSYNTGEFISTVLEKNISLCGLYPIAVTLNTIKEYSETKNTGLPEPILLDYTNSGQVSGDTDNVVAYAGMIFTWDKS